VAKAYYSTVLDQPAETVWAVIRDFNNYAVWVNGVGESHIEEAKTGEAVGAVRNVLYEGKRIRQRLLALSDVERSQTYEFCGPAPMPVHRYQATLRVTPVVDGDRSFVEWWAAFDCAVDEGEKWMTFYRDAFAKWLGSLRVSLQREKTAA
jgi:polyketide cyclase/dehydrase/lipid transport protein